MVYLSICFFLYVRVIVIFVVILDDLEQFFIKCGRIKIKVIIFINCKGCRQFSELIFLYDVNKIEIIKL